MVSSAIVKELLQLEQLSKKVDGSILSKDNFFLWVDLLKILDGEFKLDTLKISFEDLLKSHFINVGDPLRDTDVATLHYFLTFKIDYTEDIKTINLVLKQIQDFIAEYSELYPSYTGLKKIDFELTKHIDAINKILPKNLVVPVIGTLPSEKKLLGLVTNINKIIALIENTLKTIDALKKTSADLIPVIKHILNNLSKNYITIANVKTQFLVKILETYLPHVDYSFTLPTSYSQSDNDILVSSKYGQHTRWDNYNYYTNNNSIVQDNPILNKLIRIV